MLTGEGADEGDGRASQKDHLSCVRGSMERVGDSEGGWLLLSSPFKLFLHTGHVSCCIHREEEQITLALGSSEKIFSPFYCFIYHYYICRKSST